MTLDDVQKHCVDAFPGSPTRAAIMVGLRLIVARLIENRIECELWIDGSFLTGKINADDADLVLRARGEFYDDGTIEQRAVIDWVGDNLKESLRCDSYVFYEYDTNHENYWIGEYDYCYWMKQWGFTRQDERKGIAVITLDGSLLVADDPQSSIDDTAQMAQENDPVA